MNPHKLTRPRGMDCSTWAAFRRAWNATPGYDAREQLCREYGLSIDTANRFVQRGVGLVCHQPHNRRAG